MGPDLAGMCLSDVNVLVSMMRRALHIGLFIGTLIGMCACASVDGANTGQSGMYGGAEVGRTGH